MKLWDGEYSTKVHEQIWARVHFFSAVGHFAPETVTSLILDVFDSYKEARESIEEAWPGWDNVKGVTNELDPRCRLKLRVKAWAERYNIGESAFEDIDDVVSDSASWALSGAMSTMEAWYRFPNAEKKGLHRSWLQRDALSHHEQRINLLTNHPTTYIYWISKESREVAKKRIMLDLEEQVEKELNRIELEAEKESYYQTRTRKTIEQDLTWFVRFQVQEWSVPTIIKEYSLGKRRRGTVYDSLRRAEKLLGARRRKGKPGRPENV